MAFIEETAIPPVGAVVYAPGQAPEALLAEFSRLLAEGGVRTGGLIQHTLRDQTGRKTSMVVTELDTGRTLSIGQALGKDSKSCILDTQALAEASGAMRRAVDARVDIVFVNKFSKSEAEGQGLAAEMLNTMVEGIPLLTAVPTVLVESWMAFTGGYTHLLDPSPEALQHWWEQVRRRH